MKPNFLHEMMLQMTLQNVQRSHAFQEPAEKKRRLGVIIALSAELHGILENGHRFSSALARAAIEAVIIGDWYMVKEWGDHFTFVDEDEETRRVYAPVYAKFSAMCLEAWSQRPAEVEPKTGEQSH